MRHHAHAALTHDRLDQDGGGLRPDCALRGRKIGEWHLVEAINHRSEPVEIFLLAPGRERRQCPAVEGALIGDDAVALGLAVRRLILSRHLDRAFHRLGARIGEEHEIGEARLAEPRRERFALRDAIEIGNVPKLLGLLDDRFDKMGMRVSERIHRDARREIKIAVAIGCDEPNALAALERKVDARKGRKQMRGLSGAHSPCQC